MSDNVNFELIEPPIREHHEETRGAQSPEAGGRKLADYIQGKIGNGGDIVGVTAGKSVGSLIDQHPMNSNFDDIELQDAFWEILEQNFGRWNDAAV